MVSKMGITKLITYFAIFNGSFDATKPSHPRTKAARMTQEVIRIRASISWFANTVVNISFLAVSVDLRHTGFARQGKMESAQPNIQIVTTGFILEISVLDRALVTSWLSQAALVRQCEF